MIKNLKQGWFIRFFLLSFFFFNLLNVRLYAQMPMPIAGITCGNSEASNPAQKLCCKKNIVIPNNPLGNIPVISDLFAKINQLERQTEVIPCAIGVPSDINDPNCVCLSEANITPTPIKSLKKMCEEYLANSPEKKNCEDCANNGGYYSSLSCVYGDVGRFIQETIFRWAVGLAGLVALLCIIYAAIQMQLSQGSAEKIKKAQELLTSCIMGLMLIIFSVFILKVIGVDILRIPGFK